MMFSTPRHPLWPAAALLACASAHATRPMVTDDASIAAPGNCQVENWTQHTPTQTEYWTVPACNAGGPWELSAGFGRVGPDGSDAAYGAGFLQAKTVFKPLETNGWGIGLTIANQFRAGRGLAGNLSVLVPASISLLDDKVLVHANLGWQRAQTGGRQDGLWAIGTEWATLARLELTLETYGARHGPGFAQAGMRIALVSDRLALDTGIGARDRQLGTDRYFTVGLTWAGPVRP